MPRGNGTGPFGQGPRTGRGAGFCAGFDKPGFVSGGQGRGQGQGMGRGMGRGFRGKGRGLMRGNRFFDGLGSRFFGEDASASEIEMLKAQAESLEAASEEIKERIAALESSVKGNNE